METTVNLERRLAAVEAQLPPAADAVSAAEQRWHDTYNRLGLTVLASMPPERAAVVIADVQQGDGPYLPLTRRVCGLVQTWVPQGPEWEHQLAGCQCGQHYREGVPLALPEPVCALLDAHPDALFSHYACTTCGYPSGESSWAEGYPRPYFRACPLCGGRVGWRGLPADHPFNQQERAEPVMEDEPWTPSSDRG
jgi:hypothetical protein